MKYFGEYLVKKGFISSQDLIDAFLDQIMHLPPLPKLIYDQKLLTNDQIMQAFIFQQEESVDFASACKKLGFWTNEFNSKLESIYEELRVPFGQFLIQNGALDIKTLIKTLDEFLSQAERPAKKEKIDNLTVTDPAFESGVTSKPAKLSVAQVVVEQPVKTNATAPNDEVMNIPTSQCNLVFKVAALDATAREVCDFYTSGKKDELDNLLTLIRQNVTVKELASDFLQDVLKNIHTLKGVARFSKAEIIDYICNSVETLLTNYLKSSFFGTKEVGEQMCIMITKSLPLLFEVRNSISEFKTEANFWNNIDNRKKLDLWASETLKLNNYLKGVVNEAQSALR